MVDIKGSPCGRVMLHFPSMRERGDLLTNRKCSCLLGIVGIVLLLLVVSQKLLPRG